MLVKEWNEIVLAFLETNPEIYQIVHVGLDQ